MILDLRPGPVFTSDDIEIGFVTSSIKSFNLNKFIGMGYLKKESLNAKLKGNMELVSLPFVRQKYYKK